MVKKVKKVNFVLDNRVHLSGVKGVQTVNVDRRW